MGRFNRKTAVVALAVLASSAHAEIQRQSAGLSALAGRPKFSGVRKAAKVTAAATTIRPTVDAAAAVEVRGGVMATNTARGALSILGGMMVHLALGTMYVSVPNWLAGWLAGCYLLLDDVVLDEDDDNFVPPSAGPRSARAQFSLQPSPPPTNSLLFYPSPGTAGVTS